VTTRFIQAGQQAGDGCRCCRFRNDVFVSGEALDGRQHLLLGNQAHLGNRLANRQDVRFNGTSRGEAIRDRVARLRRNHASFTPG